MFFVTLQKKSGRKSRQGEVRRDRTVLLAVGALPAAREKCVFLDFIFTTNNLKQNVTTHFYRNMFCNVFVCLCISFFFRLRCQLGQNEVQNKYKRRKIYTTRKEKCFLDSVETCECNCCGNGSSWYCGSDMSIAVRTF